jgi:hypothetical protein
VLLSRYYDEEIKWYEIGRECSRHWRKKNYMQCFDTKLEGNRSLGRYKLRQGDNIKIIIWKMGLGGYGLNSFVSEKVFHKIWNIF